MTVAVKDLIGIENISAKSRETHYKRAPLCSRF